MVKMVVGDGVRDYTNKHRPKVSVVPAQAGTTGVLEIAVCVSMASSRYFTSFK